MRKAYDLAFWDAAKMGDAIEHARGLKMGKLESIRIGTMDYADLRKLGRDVMDVNTRAGDLKVGYMGSIYGISIFLKLESIPGVVDLFDPDLVPLSHVVNPRRWDRRGGAADHSLSFHPGPFSSCPDGLCLSMLVLAS